MSLTWLECNSHFEHLLRGRKPSDILYCRLSVLSPFFARYV
jgi:hypothetical protein